MTCYVLLYYLYTLVGNTQDESLPLFLISNAKLLQTLSLAPRSIKTLLSPKVTYGTPMLFLSKKPIRAAISPHFELTMRVMPGCASAALFMALSLRLQLLDVVLSNWVLILPARLSLMVNHLSL